MRTVLAALLLAFGLSASAYAQNSTEQDGHGTGAEPLVTGQPATPERKTPVIGGMNQPDPAKAGTTPQTQREGAREDSARGTKE